MYTDLDRINDFNWFVENYKRIYEEYGKNIFVIQNKKILGIYNDKNIAINIASQTYRLGTFIVQECNGDESGYTNYITSWELV